MGDLCVKTAAVLIQKVVRGFLGGIKFKRFKKAKANAAFQANFADPERYYKYAFKSAGAACKIQKWFRNLKYRRKRRWAKVHLQYVERLKQEKLFRRGVRKSGKFCFSGKDLNDTRIRMIASATVMCRIVRGFLGRRRASLLRRIQNEKEEIEKRATVRIQTMLRKTIARTRYPHVGTRYRMLQSKRMKWEKTNDALHRYVQGFRRKDDDGVSTVVDDILSETDSAASSVSGDEQEPHARRLYVHERFLRRRPSFLFLHLRLGDVEYMDSLHAPATVIQCLWRCHKARRRLENRRRMKRFRSVGVLRAWLVRVARRRRRVKAAMVIQPVWREKVRQRWRRAACATKIQTAWRTHITRRKFQRLLKRRYYSTLKLVAWARRLLSRRGVRTKLARQRQLVESRQAGVSCYTATHTRWMAHFMWAGIKVRNYTSQHELQKVFQAHSVNGGMDCAKMLKIAKECTGLISESFTLNQVEIQFTKVKNPLEKRIDYGKFIDLCVNLAVVKFMGVDPSRLAGGGNPTEEGAATGTGTAAGTGTGVTGATTTATSATALASAAAVTGGDASAGAEAGAGGAEGQLSITSFTYAGLRGRAALITRFVAEVLSSVGDYKRAVEYLDMKQLSANAQTRLLVRDNVVTIQRFVRNRIAVRKITADLVRHKAQKVAHRRARAARRIQGCIRGFLGRRLIKRLAQAMYTKFIHGETEREYWTNPRTKTSYWVKPKLLGEFDCGMATRMPKEEERYTVMCSNCSVVSATCYCVQCTEPYCTMCYAVNHRAGHRKQHVHLLVDNCVQCEFQAGTRTCLSCRDVYCDSCYKHMHRRGRLRFHVMKRNCDPCDACADLSAQWVERLIPAVENNFRQSRNWCNRCYREEHGILPADVAPTSPPTLHRLEFYGKTVQEYKAKHEKDRRSGEIAASFENRKRELQRIKAERAVRLLQRVYRGYRKRCELAPFLEERREFMRMRHEEARERDRILYKLSTLLGIAKTLKSDTPLERVMKLYPSYMHHILAISVNNNWTYACQLLVEHEERLRSAPKTNIFQKWAAKISVSWRCGRDKAAQKTLERATTVYGSAARSLAMAQESGAMAPRKLEALKASTAKAEASYKAARKQKLASEARLQQAESRLTDCVGPRGIQKLVEERRRHGLQLPFRVTLRRHSRLALVTSWVEDANLTEEELAAKPPRSPGKWKNYLSSKDFVRILGVSYRVAAPPPTIAKKIYRRPSSASSDRSSDSEGGTKSEKQPGESVKEPGDGLAAGASRKRRRKLGRSDDSSGGASSKLKKSATSSKVGVDLSEASDNSEGDNSTTPGGGGASKANPYGLELEIREPVTPDHIILDHPWLLADAYDIEIYKVLPRIFYYRPLFFLRRQLLASYPVQKTAAICAITLHKYASFLSWLQSSFDDESEAFAALQHKIDSTHQDRDKWLTISRTIVQMSFDFTLRRQVFSILYKFYGVAAGTVKFLRSLMKSAAGGTSESSYEYWKRSMEKVDVLCILDKGGGRSETIGEFKLDMKAPADIMREFIRRSFRTQLNASIGESFLFFRIDPDTAEESILLRENEFKTYSKAFCFEKTDAKTLMTSMAVLIIPDPNRGRVLIPEFAEESPEEVEANEMHELLAVTR